MNQLKMYSTNITDNQWQVIEKNINVQERKKRHYLRGCAEGYPKAGTQVPAPEEESCRRRIPRLAW